MSNDKEILATGRFLRLYNDNGWEYVERVNSSGIVVIIPITNDGNIVLVEQPRVPVGSNVIELPAGLAGDTAEFKGEALQVAAERELLEETGYEAATWIDLGEGPVSPGMSNESITLYLAKDLTKVGPGGGDEHEDITVHEVALADADQWLNEQRAKGLMVDPKVYAGLYFGK